jgi:hypothetical protein
MIRTKYLKYVPAFLFAAVSGLTALNGCSDAANPLGGDQGCSGLDVKSSAQLTVKSFSDAAVSLKAKALEVEAKYLAVCNKMNADLGLDTSKTTAGDACAVLNARIKEAAAKGVTVTANIAFNCTADVKAQADCEGSCNATASCDVRAKCDPAKLVVACMGTCSAQCDVQAPSFMCNGTCKGSCKGTAAVACSGTCEGSCDAPSFEGTCDAGCTAMFSGTCDGMCMGMCDAMNSTGACNGKCVGTCMGKATGKCGAKCTGNFKGGKCTGMCTGSCTADAAISCNGECNGTCSYTPGMATCNGECRGSCAAEVSPPRCEGSIDCMASAECRANCNASASAKLDCSKPAATVVVQGDLKLQQVLEANIGAWAEAVNLTLALKEPAGALAGKTVATFQALGDIGISGAACVASSLKAAGEASVSVNVSVSASASLNAG